MPIGADDIPDPDTIAQEADTGDARICAEPDCQNAGTTIVDGRWWCPRHIPAPTSDIVETPVQV
jgi:hypothetical protein